MDKVIVHEKNGIAAITHIAPGFVKKLRNEQGLVDDKDEVIAAKTDEEIIEAAAQKAGLNPGEYEVIDRADIPEDRYFRGAWVKKPGAVDVSMTKAQSIHMDEIRKARNARLTELDKRQYGAEYDAERQKLRDIPQDFNLKTAKTPEELKALWPQELND